MMTRKRILALLFTAISLLGLLPLSVSALTPAIDGAIYTLVDTNVFQGPDEIEVKYTPIDGTLHYFACNGIPGTDDIASIDVFTSTITEIGYSNTSDLEAVVMKANIVASAYIPSLSPLPIYFDNEPCIIGFATSYDDARLVAFFQAEAYEILFLSYVIPESNIKFTLNNILDLTDREILDTTLEAFSTELTTQNYVNWTLDGYNRIIDVFVNNAKIQYVIENPIFIIVLVVFAFAIAFAIATFIFKIFRRY